MDIKPGNIFISRDKRLHVLNYDSADDGFEEDDPVSTEDDITYKIGNFICEKYILTLRDKSWRAVSLTS
jgi:hypothetical protein